MDLKVNNNSVIVFDLDDTLYNELDFLKSAYKEIVKKIDNKNFKTNYSVIFSLYRNKKNVFDYISKTFDFDKEKLIEIYRNHFPDLSLNKGVIDLFEEIKKRGGRIALITDGRSVTQRNKIKALKIEKYFDYISISEEIGYEKPLSVPFKKVENIFKSKDYVYIADNIKKDFIMPNELGWNSIELIDNGKNIHSNSFKYIDTLYRAKNSVFNLLEIKII